MHAYKVSDSESLRACESESLGMLDSEKPVVRMFKGLGESGRFSILGETVYLRESVSLRV